MVYLASSVALAQLEIMVHLDSETLLRQNFVFISIDFDESLVEDLPLAERPHEWEDFRVQQRCKQYGSEWARSGRSALLRVPSAVVPADDNYLLNPRHPAIDTMVVSRPCSMGFDMRLFRERRD